MLSRVLAGGQELTLLAVSAGLLCVLLGCVIGLFAAYRGGWPDAFLMRAVDLALAMPAMLVILVISATVDIGPLLVGLLTAIFLAPSAARVIRGAAHSVVTRDFVAAAEAAGEPVYRILIYEIFPNVRHRVAAEFALRTGFAVLIMSSLGFLGVGVSPPNPNWGLDILGGKEVITIAPWVALFPALAIFALIMAVNALADSWGSDD